MNTHPRELPNHAEPSHAGHGDSRSLTPGIGATPGYHNALDQPTDAAKDCLEPNPAPPAGCPPSMPRFAKFGDELASAMSRAKEASRDGTGNAFTCPGIRATPGDQNALPESTDFGDCADSNDVPLAPSVPKREDAMHSMHMLKPMHMLVKATPGCRPPELGQLRVKIMP